MKMSLSLSVPSQAYSNKSYDDTQDYYFQPIDVDSQYDYIADNKYKHIADTPSSPSPPTEPVQQQPSSPVEDSPVYVDPSSNPAAGAPGSCCKSLPCWSWISIIGVFIIVAAVAGVACVFLLQDAGSADYALLPTRCENIMLCKVDPGIRDLCWFDENTLVVVQWRSDNVTKISIDKDNATCTHSLIDSGYYAERVVCSTHTQQIYVTDSSNSLIKIYNLTSGKKETWLPQGIQGPFTVSVNQEYIVVSPLRATHISVYNIKREPLYKFQVSENGTVEMSYTYLTSRSVWLATTVFPDHQLLIYDMNTDNRIHTVGESLNYPLDVVGGPSDGSVFVCDSSNNRISVFTLQGDFVSNLTQVSKEKLLPWSMSITQWGSSSIMALSRGSSKTKELLICSLH